MKKKFFNTSLHGQLWHAFQLKIRRMVILDEIEKRDQRSNSISNARRLKDVNNYSTSNRPNEKYAYLQQAVNSLNRGNGRVEIPYEISHSPELEAHLKHVR